MMAAAFIAAEEFNWDEMWQTVGNWLATNGIKLLVGIIVLAVAFCIVNVLAKFVRKTMIKKGVEKTIYTVTYNVIKKGLKVLFFLLFLGYIGVETAGIGAIIASVGVAIGLAVQGALSNFAGGIIILVLRPFKIGDYIEGQGYAGTVEDIHMFHTVLATPDNKTVVLPNGSLSNGAIVNYSAKDTRRVDLKFSISYGEDFERAKAAISDVVKKHPLIMNTPEPLIRVSEHGDSSIGIVTRVWVKKDDYWTVNYDLLESVKQRFDEDGIEIPFPQIDVHTETPQLSEIETAADDAKKTRIRKSSEDYKEE